MADLTKEQHIENINKVIKGVKYAMMTTNKNELENLVYR